MNLVPTWFSDIAPIHGQAILFDLSQYQSKWSLLIGFLYCWNDKLPVRCFDLCCKKEVLWRLFSLTFGCQTEACVWIFTLTFVIKITLLMDNRFDLFSKSETCLIEVSNAVKSGSHCMNVDYEQMMSYQYIFHWCFF